MPRKFLASTWARMHMLSFWVLQLGLLMIVLPDLANLLGWNLDKVGSVVRLLGALKAVLGALQQPSIGQALRDYVDGKAQP